MAPQSRRILAPSVVAVDRWAGENAQERRGYRASWRAGEPAVPFKTPGFGVARILSRNRKRVACCCARAVDRVVDDRAITFVESLAEQPGVR